MPCTLRARPPSLFSCASPHPLLAPPLPQGAATFDGLRVTSREEHCLTRGNGRPLPPRGNGSRGLQTVSRCLCLKPGATPIASPPVLPLPLLLFNSGDALIYVKPRHNGWHTCGGVVLPAA